MSLTLSEKCQSINMFAVWVEENNKLDEYKEWLEEHSLTHCIVLAYMAETVLLKQVAVDLINQAYADMCEDLGYDEFQQLRFIDMVEEEE